MLIKLKNRQDTEADIRQSEHFHKMQRKISFDALTVARLPSAVNS